MPKIRCTCGRLLKYKPEHAGKVANCPECSTPLTLPPAAASDRPEADNSLSSTGLRLQEEPPLPPPPPPSEWDTRLHAPPSSAREIKEAEAREKPRKTFWHALPATFIYPFHREVAPLLAVGVIVFVLAGYVTAILGCFPLIGWALQIIALVMLFGYLVGYLMEVIAISCTGVEDAPDWPDIREYSESCLQPLGYALAVAIVAFGPTIAYYFATGREPNRNILTILAALGLVYMPMGMLAVSVYRASRSLNPQLVIKAIIRAPLRYLATWVIVVLMWRLNLVILKEMGTLVNVPIFGPIAQWLVMLYCFFVIARVLGILYHSSPVKLAFLNPMPQERKAFTRGGP